MENVGKYAIHGSYGVYPPWKLFVPPLKLNFFWFDEYFPFEGKRPFSEVNCEFQEGYLSFRCKKSPKSLSISCQQVSLGQGGTPPPWLEAEKWWPTPAFDFIFSGNYCRFSMDHYKTTKDDDAFGQGWNPRTFGVRVRFAGFLFVRQFWGSPKMLGIFMFQTNMPRLGSKRTWNLKIVDSRWKPSHFLNSMCCTPRKLT